MPQRARLLFALASLAVSALAAGCGAATKATEARPPRPANDVTTKREFIARADAICERMTAESVAALKAMEDRSPAATLDRALAIQARALKALAALPVPPGDERRVGAVLLHLRRFQAAARALRKAEGEDALTAVAAVAVEMEAVERAADRYGLFRRCGAYRAGPIGAKEPPKLPRLAPPVARTAPPSARRAPTTQLLASALVPAGRRVVRREFCGGGDREPDTTCVLIELAPSAAPYAVRRSEYQRAAARAGWREVPMSGGPNTGLFVLTRDGYEATISTSAGSCAPRSTDGPGPRRVVSLRCADTIIVRETL